jgi:hypothetical protein
MSRDCTCQGLNENCMFCFGTGVVVGPRSIPTSNAFQSQKSQFRSQRSPRVPRPCPFCHRPVARLSRHIRKAHSGEASATQDARSAASSATGVPAMQEASSKALRETVNRGDPLHPNIRRPNNGRPLEQLAQEFDKSVKSSPARLSRSVRVCEMPQVP